MRLYCDEIYLEDTCISAVIELENGKFKCIEEGKGTCDKDYEGYRILPGLIDIHTHGYNGHSSQDVKVEHFHALREDMAKLGVTGFLVTAGEHSENDIENLTCIKEAIASQDLTKGAQILGIHMEGPFLNPKRRGAFLEHQLLDIDVSLMEEYIKASGNQIRYITIAPELDPDGSFIQFLNEHHIKVAGGHTIATYQQYTKAIKQGLAASTHTGNAMSQMDRRDVGTLGAALLSDDIYCEAICDLHHVSKEMLEIMFRVKSEGLKKFIMISDSTCLSGLKPGSYTWGEEEMIVTEDGLVKAIDGTICGSCKSMLDGVRNLDKIMHKDMNDILYMASLNPAKLLGIDDKKGSIKVGKDADFIIVDKDDQLKAVYINGYKVYEVE